MTTQGEQLFNPHLRGPLTVAQSGAWPGGVDPFVGYTTLQSGSATVTVSTALVQSDCMLFTTEKPGSVSVAAASGGAVVANSLVDGVSFALARQYGVAAPWDSTIYWTLFRAPR